MINQLVVKVVLITESGRETNASFAPSAAVPTHTASTKPNSVLRSVVPAGKADNMSGTLAKASLAPSPQRIRRRTNGGPAPEVTSSRSLGLVDDSSRSLPPSQSKDSADGEISKPSNAAGRTQLSNKLRVK